MTNTASPGSRRATLAVGLLWTSSTRRLVAPDWLGGQHVAEQSRIVRARAERDHVVLADVFCSYGLLEDRPDDRLAAMLELVNENHVTRLYVPGAAFANDSTVDVMTYMRVLTEQGADLILCDE